MKRSIAWLTVGVVALVLALCFIAAALGAEAVEVYVLGPRITMNSNSPGEIESLTALQPPDTDPRDENTYDEQQFESSNPAGSSSSSTQESGESNSKYEGYLPELGYASKAGGWLNSFWIFIIFVVLYALIVLLAWLLLRLRRFEREAGFPFERTWDKGGPPPPPTPPVPGHP